MSSSILLPKPNSTEYPRKNTHNAVDTQSNSYCKSIHSALNIEPDSYQAILPYLIQNIPVLIRTDPDEWLSFKEGIINLRNHTEFCDQNICAVEEFHDEKNDNHFSGSVLISTGIF